MEDTYVYRLWFECSEKSYIGMTKHLRKRYKDHQTTKSTNKKKDNWIKKYLDLGEELQIEILHGPLLREEACELEKIEIASRNNLVNLASGGEGFTEASRGVHFSAVQKFAKPRIVVDVLHRTLEEVKNIKRWAEERNLPYKQLLYSQYSKRKFGLFNSQYKVFTLEGWREADQAYWLSDSILEDYKRYRSNVSRENKSLCKSTTGKVIHLFNLETNDWSEFTSRASAARYMGYSSASKLTRLNTSQL